MSTESDDLQTSSFRPLKIAICGPADLSRFDHLIEGNRPATPGYAAPIISQLALALHGRGHDVSVVTLSPHTVDAGAFSGDRFNLLVATMRPRLRWVDAFRAERRAITNLLSQTQAEVIHAQWSYEFALGALATGLPTVTTLRDWGPAVLRYHRDHYRLVRLAMQMRVLRVAPHLTANSAFLAETAQRWARTPIAVVPNGLDFPDQIPVRIEPTQPIIGSLANGFGRLKNTSTLIESFALIRQKYPSATLRLAGQGHESGGKAERWASEQGLCEGVEFLGYIGSSEVSEFLVGLTVLAHPSRTESMAMSLVEAIRAGVAVVAGQNSGGVPWVLDEGAAGVLVDINSATELADGILSLLDNEADRTELELRAFANLSGRFGIDHVVDLYEQQYLAALGDQTSR
jgi:glycosyltransferase involved in cell wall biosynthesis